MRTGWAFTTRYTRGRDLANGWPLTIDKHTLALISIIGSSLDVLGALYLTYDLLGGEHGPLRTLTRAVTYGVLFGTGYGLVLGPIFGLASGAAHGITLGREFSHISRNLPKPGVGYDFSMSLIRGMGFGIGAGYLYGPKFGLAFGAMSAVAQTIAYQFGIRPTLDYQPQKKLRLTRTQMLAVVNRTVGYAVGAYLCARIFHQPADALVAALKLGITMGVITTIFGSCTSFVEWIADTVPEKRMGVFGIGLILIGFLLQSVQYWVALLDVTIRG